MRKDGLKTGKQGGQRKNGNAIVHAGYCKFIDKRTKDGKWIQLVGLNWIQDLGGFENVSTMQLSILENLAIIAWRCRRLGRAIVEGNGNVTESLTKDYIRFHNALVDGLKTIGLERRARNIDSELKALQEKYSYSIPVPAIPVQATTTDTGATTASQNTETDGSRPDDFEGDKEKS